MKHDHELKFYINIKVHLTKLFWQKNWGLYYVPVSNKKNTNKVNQDKYEFMK